MLIEASETLLLPCKLKALQRWQPSHQLVKEEIGALSVLTGHCTNVSLGRHGNQHVHMCRELWKAFSLSICTPTLWNTDNYYCHFPIDKQHRKVN